MANTPMIRKNWVDGDWVRLPMSFSAGGGPAVEVDTGFVLPKGAMIHPMFIYLDVITSDSGITVDVGILSTQSGDADGLLAAASVASTGIVKPTVTVQQGTNAHYISATTYGVYFLAAALKGSNSTAEHNAVPIFTPYISDGTSTNISYTVLTASDTFVGWLMFRVFQIPIY